MIGSKVAGNFMGQEVNEDMRLKILKQRQDYNTELENKSEQIKVERFF